MSLNFGPLNRDVFTPPIRYVERLHSGIKNYYFTVLRENAIYDQAGRLTGVWLPEGYGNLVAVSVKPGSLGLCAEINAKYPFLEYWICGKAFDLCPCIVADVVNTKTVSVAIAFVPKPRGIRNKSYLGMDPRLSIEYACRLRVSGLPHVANVYKHVCNYLFPGCKLVGRGPGITMNTTGMMSRWSGDSRNGFSRSKRLGSDVFQSMFMMKDFTLKSFGLAIATEVAREFGGFLTSTVVKEVKTRLIEQLWTSVRYTGSGEEKSVFTWYTNEIGEAHQNRHRFYVSSEAAKAVLVPHIADDSRLLWFTWNKRFFWMYVTSNDYGDWATVTICTTGRSSKPILEFMKMASVYSEKHKQMNVQQLPKTGHRNITIVKSNGREWGRKSTANGREPTSVAFSQEVLDQTVGAAVEWTKSREFYYERGIPYKLCLLLYGPAGTGKSTLGRVIATVTGRPIYAISITQCRSDQDLINLFETAPAGCIIFLEEVDGAPGIRKPEYRTDEERASLTAGSSVGPTTILELIDGIDQRDDIIIIMTTNHRNKLLDELTRDGRVDSDVYVGLPSDAVIRQHISLLFPDNADDLPVEPFPEIGCNTVEKLFRQNRNNFPGFIASVMNYTPKIIEGDKVND